jgi:hypothetical protein
MPLKLKKIISINDHNRSMIHKVVTSNNNKEKVLGHLLLKRKKENDIVVKVQNAHENNQNTR